MATYNNVLRKAVKWYRKIAIEINFRSVIVNAYIAYKQVTRSNMSVTEFRKKVLEGLLSSDDELVAIVESIPERKRMGTHTFAKKE